MTNTVDDMCLQQFQDIGDGFSRFCRQYYLSFNISVGHQHPKDVTNILEPSLTPETCHKHKFINTYVAQLARSTLVTNIGDDMYRRQFKDVGDGFTFLQKRRLSTFNRCHQHPKMTPTSRPPPYPIPIFPPIRFSKFFFRMVMIDMCNTFPYFLVKNEKVETEVPSIICPSEDGSYYKDEWLGHKTPKRFIHVAMMQSLGGDRTGSKCHKLKILKIVKFLKILKNF